MRFAHHDGEMDGAIGGRKASSGTRASSGHPPCPFLSPSPSPTTNHAGSLFPARLRLLLLLTPILFLLLGLVLFRRLLVRVRGRLLQFASLAAVRLRPVQVGKDELEDVAEPAGRATLEALLDVLLCCDSMLVKGSTAFGRGEGAVGPLKSTHLRELQPVRHIVRWENDHLASSAARRHRLLPQSTNPEDLPGQGQLTSHSDSRVYRLVECQ